MTRAREYKLVAAKKQLTEIIANDEWQPGGLFNGTPYNFTDPLKDGAFMALSAIDKDATEEALVAAGESTNDGVKAWAIKTLGEFSK